MADDKKPGTILGSLGTFLFWAGGIVVATLIGIVVTNNHMAAWRYFFPEPSKLVAPAEALEAIASDLEKAEKEDRAGRRYLLLAHLHVEGGTEEERAKAREAARDAVAWLSPKGAAAPLVPLGPHNCVLRVDLKQLGWDEEKWMKVLEAYPYALDAAKGDPRLAAAEARVRKIQPLLPCVRADWFAARAGQPPLAAGLKAEKELPDSLTKHAQAYAEHAVGAERLAAEMGANIGELKAKIKEEKRLAEKQGLKPLAEGKTVTREALEDRRFGTSPYQDLAQELKLGTPSAQY